MTEKEMPLHFADMGNGGRNERSGEVKRWYISDSAVSTINSIDEVHQATHYYNVQCRNTKSSDLPPKLVGLA